LTLKAQVSVLVKVSFSGFARTYWQARAVECRIWLNIEFAELEKRAPAVIAQPPHRPAKHARLKNYGLVGK
jgi:hypothetical protein